MSLEGPPICIALARGARPAATLDPLGPKRPLLPISGRGGLIFGAIARVMSRRPSRLLRWGS